MTRRSTLPESLTATPFTVADARELGVSRSRMRAADLLSPTRGVRRLRAEALPPEEDDDLTPSERMRRLLQRLREDVEGFAPALTPHQFFSHETGLALLGAPLPYTRQARRGVHISVRRPHAMPRRCGVIGHRLQARADAFWGNGLLRIEHPARLWRQAAAHWRLDDLIVAGDFLVHPRNRLLTVDELRREVDEAGEVRGLLRPALEEIRTGAESSEETRLRLLLMRAGLPEPELNLELFDVHGAFVARLDLAYPQYRVAAEYDGRGHAGAEQFARDADRWDAIRAEHWRHVRILSHHLRPDPQVAVDKVAVALFEAGWRPGHT